MVWFVLPCAELTKPSSTRFYRNLWDSVQALLMETMHLITAGLNLKLRARLQGCLANVHVEVVSNSAALNAKLEELKDASAGVHLVWDEKFSQQSPGEFLEQLPKSFTGQVVLCAHSHLHASDLSRWTRSHRLCAVLQDPVDPNELVRRVAIELSLGLKNIPKSQEPVHLQPVWDEHRQLVLSRLDCIQKAAQAEPQAATMSEVFEEARRASHQLTGSLGAFKIEQAPLLTREIENLLEAAHEGQVIDSRRLTRLVQVLRQKIESFSGSEPTLIPSNHLVLVSDDDNLIESLALEALLYGWSTYPCLELPQLPNYLQDPLASTVVIDMQAQTCRENPALIAELLRDPVSKVIIDGEQPVSGLEDLPKQLVLKRPVDVKQAILAVLRAHSRIADEHRSNVLIVDDDIIILKVIRSMLSHTDFQLTTLTDPLEFFEQLQKCRPDIVLLDVEIPPLGGIELCRSVRRDPLYSALPIILMSSYTDSQTVQRAYEAGADDFLFKPLTSLELLTRISNRLERTRQIGAWNRLGHPTTMGRRSLDQAILKSLNEDSELSLALISMQDEAGMAEVQSKLRQSLRVGDVVRSHGPLETVVAFYGAGKGVARRRIRSILGGHGSDYELRIALCPQDGRDFQTLVDVAQKLAPESEGAHGSSLPPKR